MMAVSKDSQNIMHRSGSISMIINARINNHNKCKILMI